MKAANGVIALGFATLVTAIFGLYSVAARQAPEAPIAPPLDDGAITNVISSDPGLEWTGVDRAIQRVLTDLGLAATYRPNEIEELSPEVVRVLSAYQAPLVSAELPGGGS